MLRVSILSCIAWSVSTWIATRSGRWVGKGSQLGLLKAPLGREGRPPQAAEIEGEQSEVKRRESFVFFFSSQGVFSCMSPSCHPGPFSRKISPEYSPD